MPEAERLVKLSGGQLVLRYWEAPRAWPSSGGAAIVAVFPSLPDTGYPKPDFAVPVLPLPESPENASILFWPILLAILLGLVLFHRPLGLWVQRAFRRLYWRLRWETFLLRYPPHRQLPLAAYAQVFFQLVTPYCDFHPGSILPEEAAFLSGPSPFQRLFQVLLPPLYEERFLQKPLSPIALQNLSEELYALLREARPYAGMPHRYRLCLCL